MTAKLITIFNQKGGCGKTNLTMQLAGALGLRRFRVLIVDMDPQGTATQWAYQASDAEPFPARVFSLAEMGSKVHRELRAYLEDFDFIFVDCPPSVESPAASSAMLVSDLALMPVVPAPADLWATQKAKTLTEQVQTTNETLIVRMVPSMVQSVTRLAKASLGRVYADKDIQATRGYLGARTAYRECQLFGATVHALPYAVKAITEVEALTDEVLEILGMGTMISYGGEAA